MRVKVFKRHDGATVVLPLDLCGLLPPVHDGPLMEIGDADLDLSCLAPEFVTQLGLRGYCIATGDDVARVLDCVTQWKEPVFPDAG